MKKLGKIIFSCAAAAAITALAGTAAMAATYDMTGGITGSYDDATGKLTINAYDSLGARATILVLNKDSADVVAEDIVQLGEKDGNYAEIPVADPAEKPLTDGTYYVRIGGSESTAFKSGSFTIGESGEKRLLGDVNGDKNINVGDAAIVVAHTADSAANPLDGDSLKAADANKNGSVTIVDAVNILYYTVDKDCAINKGDTID